MAELKNSEVLERIIGRAKELSSKTNSTMTAERFFVGLIDEIDSRTDAEAELKEVKRIITEHNIDLVKTREALVEYITGNGMTFLDGIYMQKKMYEVRLHAEQKGEKEVSAPLLLSCILADPSDGLRKILASAEKQSDENQELSGEDLEELLEVKFNKLFGVLDTPDRGDDSPKQAAREVKFQDTEGKSFSKSVKTEMAALIASVKHIRSVLQNSILGQDHAINVFTTGYFQACMTSLVDKSRKRPRATFLFAGPPGVGKTFLAEKAAEALQMPYMRFDMSEYADKEANLEFCGTDKVYKNGKAGNVTEFVAENPRCVLLFDEIEKAHVSVIHLFLQMLDAGRLRDNYTDKEVSFSDAIIILTTNAGKSIYEESEGGDFSAVSRKVIIGALRKDINPETHRPFFPAAICSRFASGNVVMFNHVSAHILREIARKEIERHATNLKNEIGISLQIDEGVYTALLLSEGSAADARTIRSRAETFFHEELYELLRLIASDKVESGIENLENIQISIDLSHAKADISDLFASSDKTKVLVFANREVVAVCQENAPEFEFIGAQDVTTAVEIMKSQDVDFVLLHMNIGAQNALLGRLNIEDEESPARDFFKLLREQRKDLPVYLLETNGAALDEEEQLSFIQKGVRGVIKVGEAGNSFASQLGTIALHLHQQASMMKLEKENKLVSFETAQTVSENGKCAEIKLFDFEMAVAVDSEDAKNILSSVSMPNVHFDDVIGAKGAKKELTYFVEYLKNPKKYMDTGVKAPKGLLLYGPPGTGKTLLAKAMACEAGVPFIAAEGNQFLRKYVWEGSEKVHELFKLARKYAPSILFIDEIDAIAKERKGGVNGASTGEETLTAFLTEMDGFENNPSKPVFVLAATNFEVEAGKDKSLDPALMRRFDRRVYIELPDTEERIQFLRMKISGNRALDVSDAQIGNIAMRATGMSLAELDSVVELALRSAIREGRTTVDDAVFEEAFETFNSGEVKKWDISQLERVARHEAGHAFLCWLSGHTPSYLTIVARGMHGGYMQHAEQEGKAIYTKEELLARIRISLGGRAAEIAYYGAYDGISTGASGDLAAATGVARQIVCTYGMDDEFGLAVVDSGSAAGSALSVEVRNAINRILKEQMEEAIKLISANKDKIDSLVAELMTKNHLNGAEIQWAITKNS